MTEERRRVEIGHVAGVNQARVSERLRRGLQILLPGFKSQPVLQKQSKRLLSMRELKAKRTTRSNTDRTTGDEDYA